MAEETKTEREPSEFGKHMRSAMRSVRKQWGSLIPDEFWQHRREARREMLLAMRSIVDAAINRLEPEEEKPAAKPGTRRKTKVEVE
jgi:hypothetical protein